MRIRFWTTAVLSAVLGLGAVVDIVPTLPAAYAQDSAEAALADEMRQFGEFGAAHQAVLVPLIQAMSAAEFNELLNAILAVSEGADASELEVELDKYEDYAAEVVRASLAAEAAIPPKPKFTQMAKDDPSGARDLIKLADTVEANTREVAKDLRSIPVQFADMGRAVLAGDDGAVTKVSRLVLTNVISILESENQTYAIQIPLMSRRGQPMRQITQLQLMINLATTAEAELDLSDFDAPDDESSEARAARRASFIRRMRREIKKWESVETRGRAQIDVFRNNMRRAMAGTSDPRLKSMFTTLANALPENHETSFDVESELMRLMSRRISLLEADGPDMEAELEAILEDEVRLFLMRLDLATERVELIQ